MLLEPGRVLWVDVVVPTGDALWDADVAKAFHWLGHAWVDALAAFGLDGIAHTGPLVRTPLSRQVCFAGLGPGEVTVDGRKVIGISQRRTRDHALFQCAALAAWEPTLLADLLGLDDDARADLAAAAAPIPRPASDVVDALCTVLGVLA